MTLRSRLLAALLAMALVPTAIVSTVALVQLSRAIARWYRPGVDRTLVSALELTQSAVARFEGALLVDAEEWAARWPDGPDTPAREREAGEALRGGGADFLQVYAPDAEGHFRRVRELSPPGVLLADVPDLSDQLSPPSPHPRVVRTDGVLAAAALTPTGRVLVAGIRLTPDFFAQVDSVSHGATYYRQLGVTAELRRRVVLFLVAGMGVLLVVAALFLSARLARQMSRPLQELSSALGRVAGGELSARVAPTGAPEMRSLADSFNVMTERLEEARHALLQAEREAAWRDVARKLAHEFKNTLTPMRLQLQLLEARVEHADPEQRAAMNRSLAATMREVESLQRLAVQFSQYARLPEPAFEPLDALEAAGAAAALLPGVPIEVCASGQGSTKIRADHVLVSRALHNLMLNACEVSPPEAKVEVVVRPSPASVAIEVLDRGPGLPAELRDRLFEPYVSTKRRGSGLGLSLVRDIARQHQGSVSLEDRPGGGARAVLTLPRNPEPAAPVAPVAPNPGGSRT